MRATSRGGFVVIARDKGSYRVDKLVAEGGAIGRRSKPDLGVQRQCRQPFVGCP
jgi:hypothetical protein